MGMQQKLEKEYQRGFNDGQGHVNDQMVEMARMGGIVQGAKETWDIIEKMIPQLPGIGPKTQEKILRAISAHVKIEREKFKK